MDPAAVRGGGRAGRLSVSCAAASLPLYAYNASRLAGKVYYLFEDDLVVGILYPQTGAFLVRRTPRNAVGWLLILTSVLGITPWLSPECLLGDALVADSYCARTAIRIVAIHQPHLLFATDNYSGSETATGGPTNSTQLARPTRPGSPDLPAANEHVNVFCLRRRHRPLLPTRPPRQAQNRQQHRHRRPDRPRRHRQEPRRPRLRQGRQRRGHSDRLSITATP
jgi:hypothetical protein